VSNQFREIDRSQPITLPGNLEGWLDGNDLAHFIVEVVEVLDTGAIEGEYRGGGSAPYPPKMLLALLFYCYAKGIFTSRKIERATYELIPVLYVTGGTHPDHDSINTFRQRFWLLLGFEDVIKFELRPPCACPPCAASTTSSMKVNVTKKSDGNVGPTGCVVRAARPTKSPSAVATTANKHADDTLVRTVENGLTTSPGLSSWGGINPCRSGSPTCT
jgi:transposase